MFRQVRSAVGPFIALTLMLGIAFVVRLRLVLEAIR